MEFTKERLEALLNECIGYIDELKERDDEDEKDYFWTEVIGMTENEMKYFGVKE